MGGSHDRSSADSEPEPEPQPEPQPEPEPEHGGIPAEQTGCVLSHQFSLPPLHGSLASEPRSLSL